MMRKFNSINLKCIYLLIGFTVVVRYISFVYVKLIDGARWSSGLLLGGVDNWMSGGSLYTIQDEGMTPGSSYNPGSLLLAIGLRYMFGYGAETGIIICGAIFMAFMILGVSLLVIDDIKNLWKYILVSCLFFFFEFHTAKFYLLEFHPDIPAFVCFLWAIIGVDCFLKSRRIRYALGALLLMFLSGLFKQNAVFLYIGFGLFLILSKEFNTKTKVQLLILESLAGIGVLITMLSIKGCWYNCVVVNSLHPLMTLDEYLSYLRIVVLSDKCYLIFVLGYMISVCIGKISLSNLREKMWLSSAAFWFMFCMYGSAKEGANDGNIEAAVIVFLPFAVKFAWKIANMIKRRSDFVHKMMNLDIIRILGCVILLFICLVIVGKLSYNIIDGNRLYCLRLSGQKEFSRWLSVNFSGQNLAYHTNSYELLNNSTTVKKTDLYTVSVYCLGGLLNDKDLSVISEKEKWDLIVTIPGHGSDVWPITFSKFKKLDRKIYSSLLVNGENVDVYIRK